VTASNGEWVSLLLGPTWASKVRYTENSHDGVDSSSITGTVVSIQEVTCSRTSEQRGTDAVWVPVPGSGVLNTVADANKWRPEPPAHLHPQVSFDGWIVELETVK
jgi:hypothetical protein